jgi:alanine racemase
MMSLNISTISSITRSGIDKIQALENIQKLIMKLLNVKKIFAVVKANAKKINQIPAN